MNFLKQKMRPGLGELAGTRLCSPQFVLAATKLKVKYQSKRRFRQVAHLSCGQSRHVEVWGLVHKTANLKAKGKVPQDSIIRSTAIRKCSLDFCV